MMKVITCITTDMLSNYVDSDGRYELEHHGKSFVYDDVRYTYIASGLCRKVFKSECGNFVIKVPIGDVLVNSEIIDVLHYVVKGLSKGFPDINITHNIGEAEAYLDCPVEYKKYLAETELLPNCWIKQEFVSVIDTSFFGMHQFRELGLRKDGTICIFDYDPMLEDFTYTECNWERIKNIVDEISYKYVKKN